MRSTKKINKIYGDWDETDNWMEERNCWTTMNTNPLVLNWEGKHQLTKVKDVFGLWFCSSPSTIYSIPSHCHLTHSWPFSPNLANANPSKHSSPSSARETSLNTEGKASMRDDEIEGSRDPIWREQMRNWLVWDATLPNARPWPSTHPSFFGKGNDVVS